MLISFWKKTKQLYSKIERRVPYIPNFGDVWTILKILLLSFTICIIYSFSQIERVSDFYFVFWDNIKEFSPYIIVQMILLIVNSRIIKKLNPFNAILYMIILNFATVYLVYSLFHHSYTDIFIDLDETSAKFILSFGILFFFLIYFDWREKNVHPAQLQAQLSFLQSKMHPHFLFNTINSIVSLIKKEPDTAKKMLINLAEILRASLKENANFTHTLSQEINLCQRYLDLEKMRLGERLNVIWDVDKALEKIAIPKLSIQPLIENSILHGIQKLEIGGDVSISIKKDITSRVMIKIKNPVAEDDKKDNSSHNNISMKNLQERLDICFDGNILIDTYKKEGYFYVNIDIPLSYELS